MKELPPSQTPAPDDPEELPDFEGKWQRIAPRVLADKNLIGKHKTFTKAYAMRCRVCFRPVILTIKYPEVHYVDIDASSWDGNVYYVKGKHHVHFCRKRMDRLIKRKSDTFVGGPK